MNRLLQFPVALLILFCLSGCNDDRKWSWHQKLTITVMTPSGMKIASSVQRGTIEKYGWWQHQWGYDGSEYVTGESVVLEVAPGKFLFALLSSTPRAWTVFVPNEEFRESAGPALAALRETREVSQKDYPLLVTFEDINDPKSIKRVDPKRLDTIFGAGYRLNSITMSITDETPTKGRVQAVLPWLEAVGRERGSLKGNPSKGYVSDQQDPALWMIAPTDFLTGLYLSPKGSAICRASAINLPPLTDRRIRLEIDQRRCRIR